MYKQTMLYNVMHCVVSGRGMPMYKVDF